MRPPPSPPWLDETGWPLRPSLRPLLRAGDTLTRRKVCLLIFGDATVLGAGCPVDQQVHWTHGPHPEELPNPLGLQVLVLIFLCLLWFHEACELGQLTRLLPPASEPLALLPGWRCGFTQPEPGGRPMHGKPQDGSGLLLPEDLVGRLDVAWAWLFPHPPAFPQMSWPRGGPPSPRAPPW